VASEDLEERLSMASPSDHAKKALVVVLADVENDPRVRRQIEWLTSEGWTVDSLGRGVHPTPKVRNHYAMAAPPRWTKTFLGLGLIHTLLPYRARFRVQAESLFPDEVSERVRSGEYDVVILNDTHLLPWLSNRSTFPTDARVAHVHIDLHEWFSADVPAGTRGTFLLQGYHRWTRNHIVHPLVDTRSVAGGTAELYVEEFGVDHPILVRNAPPFEDLEPTPVDPAHIRLIHHGLAAWPRGFRQMVDAMRLVDERFSLTFMLAGSQKVIAELGEYIADQSDRISIVPPAAMVDLARTINPYDVEVMFFPPVTRNLETTLPNKLFEAVQGRLAVVIGPTKMMVQVVEEYGNGLVSPGWSPEELAATINQLTGDDVTRMKAISHTMAPLLSAENEKKAFFRSFRQRASDDVEP
jgi:glycosyltransferase involved in cell wall biosynthesis